MYWKKIHGAGWASAECQLRGSMVGFVRKKIHNLVSDKKFSEILRGSVWALGAKVLATIFMILG